MTAVSVEGDLLHLRVTPIRDPDRNRMREIYVDTQTYELRKLIATDKLFLGHIQVHPQRFTMTIAPIDGRPVITAVHAVVTDDYSGDAREQDYQFKDIKFPSSLPDWYFEAHSYAAHAGEAPL